ncbi:MAG TPA: chromosome segregation protein SMC [Longimicrobiaceae bacterium]|nr:chromosome segregation protein SMC [Longimicrobiaceae bacterium]
MKLKSLNVHGFKSFPDRTTLEFRDGVTAIVGSNGCGKSNIADAVRWVLGEQRASAMRGSRMDEVIFQGTSRRRPLNFAEVSLVFDNESGRVPVPHSEVAVNRKVFREGGSEYSLNRESCRLREIQGLLRDTGLGSNAYAIIEATMIETLLSDRAEERRALFEEAAGIGKYKDSRRGASRRLEAAENDLARLDDLIGEVQSKVRSLARQRGKAQRHRELQERRLDLEVAIARRELAGIAAALAESEERHHELGQVALQASAERTTAEALEQAKRLDNSDLARTRAAAAARLDELREKLDEHERMVLLADERRSHAELRIANIARERSELEERRKRLAEEMETAATAGRGAVEGLLEVRGRWESVRTASGEAREAVLVERAANEALATRSRELAREIATVEAQRTATERRNREAAERIARIEPKKREIEDELTRVGDQTELWTGQAEDLRSRAAAAHESADSARAELNDLRSRETGAREVLSAAEDSLSRLRAQLEAREAVERSYEGFSPAVAALMAVRDRFPGVHGPLADFMETDQDDSGTSTAVESYLGSLLQAVIVDDLATARALRTWLREEWEGQGSLLLLPLDSPGRKSGAPSTHALVNGRGVGAEWVGSLLADLEVLTTADPLDGYYGGARISLSGDLVDDRGAVTLHTTGDAAGILSRRDKLARLKTELEASSRERDALAGKRDSLREAVAAAEHRIVEADEQRRVANEDLRRLEADTAAQIDRQSRLEAELDEISRTISQLTSAIGETSAQIEELDGHLTEYSARVESCSAEADTARSRLAQREAAWETAREEEAELRVAVVRSEGEQREAERRAREAETGMEAAASRLVSLSAEEKELHATLEELSVVKDRAGGEIHDLFGRRDAETGNLASIDTRMSEVEAEIALASTTASAARRREAECSEGRHRLELEHADFRSRLERVQERLEVEWGRTWDALVASANPLEGDDLEAWRDELESSAARIEGLGPVNMLAVEEHAEEERRLDFLLEQRDDLVKARDDLTAAIRQINQTAREIFESTFDAVRDNFKRTFQSLFAGGDCDIRLEDPDDPLESPVLIQASPKGKKTQRIHLLSGGERTLTALALLFALYLVKPSPFCVLDEVDAPLDDSNVGRFLKLLDDFKGETQFVVITHNPRTMESADWIYGVTMEEPGVSSIVGVELLGAWQETDQVA